MSTKQISSNNVAAVPAAAPSTPAAPAPAAVAGQMTTPNGYRLPENTTLQHAAKLAVVEDKPIMLDYWTNSLEKTVLIGVKDNKEKLLVKSEEEYTSPIAKIFKVGKEYIVMTENSIYIVDVEIPTKRISA